MCSSDLVTGLNDVVRPQEGQPFSVQREAQGLQQLQARRELALRALEQALGSGDAEQIAQALGQVTTQEKAFREQVQRLQKEGYAPYLNLVDAQQRRVLSGVKAAQGVLDGLIERGADITPHPSERLFERVLENPQGRRFIWRMLPLPVSYFAHRAGHLRIAVRLAFDRADAN